MIIKGRVFFAGKRCNQNHIQRNSLRDYHFYFFYLKCPFNILRIYRKIYIRKLTYLYAFASHYESSQIKCSRHK